MRILLTLAVPVLARDAAAAAGPRRASRRHAARTRHRRGRARRRPRRSRGLLPDPHQPRARRLQALWVVIIFVVLLVILYPTAWKNVLAGLKKREERIRQDIADAEAAAQARRGDAERVQRAARDRREQVRDMLAKATADGEQLATNIRMQAQQEAEEIKERATARHRGRAQDAAVRQSTSRPPTSRPASPRRSCAGTSTPTTSATWSRAASSSCRRSGSNVERASSRAIEHGRVDPCHEMPHQPTPPPPSPTPGRCWSWRTSGSRPSRSAQELHGLREVLEAEPDVRARSSPTRRSATTERAAMLEARLRAAGSRRCC